MKFALSVALAFVMYNCTAQETIHFFNEDGRSVKEKQAVVLQQQIKLNDTLWEFNNYLITGPMYVSMQTLDEKGSGLNGRYLAYNRKGDLDSAGQYSNGLREGKWYTYSSKGRIIKELTYDHGKLTGKKDSAQINEEGKKWRDSAFAGRTVIEVEAEFPGGSAAWLDYLNHHFRYPDRGINKAIQGTSIVEFIVDKDGSIDPRHIRIDHSVEFSIDRESIKTIQESPSWRPAVQDGKVVKSHKKQPFVLKLTKG
jgi:protein TonB